MAIDVLTYNALQEVNQELRQELADLTQQVTDAGGGGGGGGANTPSLTEQCNTLRKVAEAGYMLNANQWCLIPTTMGACPLCPDGGTAFTTGFKVCDTTGYYRCGANCTWTVPSGTTCARFQIWGAGGGSNESRCCGFAPSGSSGAYASVIIPVSAGNNYTLCAGCAYCCYAYSDGYNQSRGDTSYVQGTNLSNFCALGGWSGCIFKEQEDRADQFGPKIGQFCYCRYLGGCICRSGAWVCAEYETQGQGYPEGHCSGVLGPWVSRCVCFYGTSTGGSGVYGHRGMWSYISVDNYMPALGWISTMYGYPQYCCGRGGCWVCNSCGGFCQSAWQTGVRPMPGAAGFMTSSCGGNCTCGDAGRMGMVCVSYN